MNLTKRSVKGAPLTWNEVDNNWQLIEDYCNGNTGPRITKTVTLVTGDNDVTHAAGKKPYDVKFFMANGRQTDYTWKRKAGSETTVIVVTVPADINTAELANTEINILV